MFLFDWDEEKNTINQKKHGVSFEEASTFSLMRKHCLNTISSILMRRTALEF